MPHVHPHLLKAVLCDLLVLEGESRVVDEDVELVLLEGKLLGKLAHRGEAGQVQVHHSQLPP